MISNLFKKIAADALAALHFGAAVVARLENIEAWIEAHVAAHNPEPTTAPEEAAK